MEGKWFKIVTIIVLSLLVILGTSMMFGYGTDRMDKVFSTVFK